jgi:hypothetical protein
MTRVPAPTPARRSRVLSTSSTSWVRQRWSQTSTRGRAREETTAAMGTATTLAIPIATHVQGYPRVDRMAIM